MSVSTELSHEVLDPATERHVATIALTSVEETDAAIERSHRAFQQWRHVAPADRARLLRRFAAVVDGAREELAAL